MVQVGNIFIRASKNYPFEVTHISDSRNEISVNIKDFEDAWGMFKAALAEKKRKEVV